MNRSVQLEAVLAVIPDVVGVAPLPVVAIPPSDIDPISDEMRIAYGFSGTMISRAFDPGDDIVTGGPIALLTEAGNTLTTEAGNRIVSEVA